MPRALLPWHATTGLELFAVGESDRPINIQRVSDSWAPPLRSVAIWNTASNHPIAFCHNIPSPISCLACSPDLDEIAVGTVHTNEIFFLKVHRTPSSRGEKSSASPLARFAFACYDTEQPERVPRSGLLDILLQPGHFLCHFHNRDGIESIRLGHSLNQVTWYYFSRSSAMNNDAKKVIRRTAVVPLRQD